MQVLVRQKTTKIHMNNARVVVRVVRENCTTGGCSLSMIEIIQ